MKLERNADNSGREFLGGPQALEKQGRKIHREKSPSKFTIKIRRTIFQNSPGQNENFTPNPLCRTSCSTFVCNGKHDLPVHGLVGTLMLKFVDTVFVSVPPPKKNHIFLRESAFFCRKRHFSAGKLHFASRKLHCASGKKTHFSCILEILFSAVRSGGLRIMNGNLFLGELCL